MGRRRIAIICKRFWTVAIYYLAWNQILVYYLDLSEKINSGVQSPTPSPADVPDVYARRDQQVRATCHKYGFGRRGGRFPGDPVAAALANLFEPTVAEETKYFYRRQWRKYKRSLDKTTLFAKEPGLTFCWTHKVASSSWNSVFFHLAGKEKVPFLMLHTAAQKLNPQSPSDLRLATSDKSLRFYFVRHPFERLVSAFVDKFEIGNKADYIFKVFNPKVIAANVDLSKSLRPSFKQFVRYLLKTPVEEYNDHWIPFWLHCHLCQVHYDIIGNLSTLAEDSKYIAERAHISHLNISWINRGSVKKGPARKYSRPEEYFRKELSAEDIEALYKIYRLDFEMFGFSPESYFKEEPHKSSGIV